MIGRTSAVKQRIQKTIRDVEDRHSSNYYETKYYKLLHLKA